MKKFFDRLIQIVGLSLFIFAIWIICQEGKKVGWQQLYTLILTTPLHVLLTVFLVMILDYFVLSGYDILALKYLRKKIPYPLILKASTVGFAIGNTIGHSYLSGGAVRYLFYLKHGLSRTNIMILIAFETIVFCLGLMTTYIIAVCLLPLTNLNFSTLHLFMLYLSGFLVLLGLIFYGLCVVKFHKCFHIGKAKLATPSPKNTLAEIIVSCADNFLLNLVFFILLKYHFDISFIDSFVVCVIAMTIGMCMQSPGGLGIFEGLVLLALPHTPAQTASILAGLALFRVIYFFVPFILSSLYLSIRYAVIKIKSLS